MNGDNGRVLIVDDEPNALKVLSAILSADGYKVFESQDVEKAIKIVMKEDVDAIITDLKMPGRDGMQFLEYVSENHADIPVIFLTAYGTVESAVHAVKLGAFHYFIKPPDYGKLKGVLAGAVGNSRLKKELAFIESRTSEEDYPHHIIGSSPQMLKIFKTIETIKNSESSVLICGETGTGKELIALALHYHSTRKERPFIAVNCAAIPRELMESELFGYEKGAFTGALSKRVGRFEEVSGGSLFLDEIGELELPLQSKLLRVLQEREVERLGSSKKIKVDFRLISSTNRDLKKEVLEGNFREDLFYRIDVVKIDVPPLRERRDDIPLLVSEIVKEFSQREKKKFIVSDEVMEIFQNCDWPGNIRQLRNVIERAAVLSRGERITARELPEELILADKGTEGGASIKTLRELEIQAIKDALLQCKGNKSKAARQLNISRKAFYKRLKEIPLPDLYPKETKELLK
jgi:DNA-binding NtrC family response regulator